MPDGSHSLSLELETVDSSKEDDDISLSFDNPKSWNVESAPEEGHAMTSERMKAVGVGIFDIILLTCFNFPYGLICGTMGLWILPVEAQRLFPGVQSVALGFSLAIVGASQLVCPLAGKISDMWLSNTPFGKRRPFLLWGTVSATICCGLMCYCSWAMLGYSYYVSLFSSMVSLNVVYSVQCGLVPDLLSDEYQGTASGLVAVHTLLGSGAGFGMLMATTYADFHFVYPLYMVLLVFTVILTCCVARKLQNRMASPVYSNVPELCAPGSSTMSNSHSSDEFSWLQRRRHRCRCVDSKLTCGDLARAYIIDTSHGYDFFWVFIGRTFYYVAVSVQAFIFFYLRDVVGTRDDSTRRFQMGCIALLAQGTAAGLAFPIGRTVDSSKLGKKMLIYIACTCMASVYACFMITPLFGENRFLFVLGTAAIYGAGNGCFLAVDYALALATLPDKSTAAQALGIWGVSAFIGSALGPLIYGTLVQTIGGTSIPGVYDYPGYFAMLVGGIIATAIAGCVITLVKGTT